MDGDKLQEIREEHRVITDTMLDYVRTLNTARELIDSSMDQMERSRTLLSQYHRLRELAHIADVQVAKAGESLMLDLARNNGTTQNNNGKS